MCGQLSSSNSISRFSLIIRWFNMFNHCMKIWRVIHDFLFAVYCTPSWLGFTLLKQRGLLYLPTTNGCSFSPSALQHNRTVTLSLETLTPEHLSPFLTKLLCGDARNNNPVSSTLNTSANRYPSHICGIRSIHSSVVTLETTTDSPLKSLELMLCRFWNL